MNDKDLVFSNEVIIGHLQYAQSKLHKDKFEELIASLGVDRDWLYDKSAWHSAEFENKFIELFEKYLSNISNPAEESAKFLFEKKGFKRFTSLTSVLITPENLLKNLPKFIKT
ncbi:MAG: hypothetical protein JXA66_05975, partial [Oligoflexia bacterium]|nr:hypothetical protein [Oligoflexia bacterium]